MLAVIVLLQSIEGAIGGSAYQAQKVNNWTSDVVELCLGQLTKLGKPFKYIGIVFPLTLFILIIKFMISSRCKYRHLLSCFCNFYVTDHFYNDF